MFLIGALATDRENTPLTFLVLAASYPVYRALKWASRRSAGARGGSSRTGFSLCALAFQCGLRTKGDRRKPVPAGFTPS